MREINLTPQQAAAVTSDAQAVLVVASAGSGKTEVVARRVELRLAGREGEFGRVLAVTYTVKAAAELGDRLRGRLGGASRRVDTETIHGFAHALLRQYGTNIGLPSEPELLVRDEDRVELLERWLEDRGMEPLDQPLDILRQFDLARSRCTTVALLGEWEDALSQAGALDYPALLVAATRLLEVKSVKRQVTRTYDQVIVDEAQNLTAAQYAFLRALISDGDRGLVVPTMLVGDDKQSIVSFAGADPSLMTQFATDFHAAVFTLAENFRSAMVIAQATEAVARQLGHAGPIGRFAALGEVRVHQASTEQDEARVVADWVEGLLAGGLSRSILAADEESTVLPEDIAILGRSAAALRYVSLVFIDRGIGFVASSSTTDWLSSEPGLVALEVISLRTAEDHRSTHWQLGRLLNVTPEAVATINGLKSALASHDNPVMAALVPLTRVGRVEEFAQVLQSIGLPLTTSAEELAAWQSDVELLVETWARFDQETDRGAVTWGNFKLFCAKQQKGDEQAPGVRLLTIHKAQGREYRAVALVGLTDGQLPDFRATSRDELIGELRTFYVGLSRARRSLLLTWPRSRMTRYGGRASQRSRFLDILGV